MFPPGNWIVWALDDYPERERGQVHDASFLYPPGEREVEGVQFRGCAGGRPFVVALRRSPDRRLRGTLEMQPVTAEARAEVIELGGVFCQGVRGGLLLGEGRWPHPTLGPREWMVWFDGANRAEYCNRDESAPARATVDDVPAANVVACLDQAALHARHGHLWSEEDFARADGAARESVGFAQGVVLSYLGSLDAK